MVRAKHWNAHPADSLEMFVADDALQGGAFDEHHLSDDIEVIGEGDTHEGGALIKCSLSNIRNVAVFTE